MYMSDILKRPGFNYWLQEKAGRKYGKKLNSAISELVDRNSLGSNPAQKIQRIANSLYKHYADKSFSNSEIIEFIKTNIPSVKLKLDSPDASNEMVYTADNKWNSVYVEPNSEEIQPQTNHYIDNTTNVVPEEEHQEPIAINQESKKLSKSEQDALLKEEYLKRMRHYYKMEELFRR